MKQKFLRFVSKSAMFTASFGLVFSSLAPMAANAAELTNVFDVMSRQKATIASNHAIYFNLPTGVDASTDTITIEFDSASDAHGFTFGSVAFGDMDLNINAATTACATTLDFSTSKTLAASAAASTWGVAVATSTNTITLTAPTNATTGEITANYCVRLLIGTNASGGTNQISNPSGTGSKTISITTELGSTDDSKDFGVAIVTEDQVVSTGNVDPSLTFAVDTTTTAAECDTMTYNSTVPDVAFGTLAGTAKTSGAGSIPIICTKLSTNASSGATVTVVGSVNTGLGSTSVGTDKIDSPAASDTGSNNYENIATDNTEGFGLCVNGGSKTSGGVMTAAAIYNAGSATTISSENQFSASCDATAGSGGMHTVGQIDTTSRTIWSVAGPVSTAAIELFAKANISASTTPPHDDYTTTLTFIAYGTF